MGYISEPELLHYWPKRSVIWKCSQIFLSFTARKLIKY